VKKIAFLYPGQGAQKCGMGKDFYESSETSRKVYELANQVLDFDVIKMCHEEDERLNLTEYTQAALVTTSLAMTAEINARGIKADMTAGLSLGEYCAIAAAGALKAEDAVRLVRIRGQLMQNTVPVGVGAMCACIGTETELIEEITSKIDGVTVANYNCPGQIVITGVTEAVNQAAEQLKAAGAKRCIMLNVSGPFHSPLLEPAGDKLLAELEKTDFKNLEIPYVTNVTAEVIQDISKTRELLARQVSAPVKWMQSMSVMRAAGIDTFVEIGPGKTLAGFMKKIHPEAKIISIGSYEDLKLLDEI